MTNAMTASVKTALVIKQTKNNSVKLYASPSGGANSPVAQRIEQHSSKVSATGLNPVRTTINC